MSYGETTGKTLVTCIVGARGVKSCIQTRLDV